jgi:glycosyltransferase involved in cell wall biosynthesis
MSVAVIIPAHDEEVALRRCLASLARQSYGGPVEIIVVANGCGDATADVALESGALLPPNFALKLIELPVAAKWQALNAADEAARSEARIYLDADIVLSPNALEELLGVFAEEGPRLLQPEVVVGWGVHSYPVRAFVRVWSALPYVRDQVLGLGCYAVNGRGRGLWDVFPPLGADDTYVRFRFDDADKRVVRGATMTLSFPATLRELILVRARWCRLSREVRRKEPFLPPSERRRWAAAARFVSARPAFWLDGLFFTAIWACAVFVSRLPTPQGDWARAATSEIRLSR